MEVTILTKIIEEHEAKSTFAKNKNFVFVIFRLPQVSKNIKQLASVIIITRQRML